MSVRKHEVDGVTFYTNSYESMYGEDGEIGAGLKAEEYKSWGATSLAEQLTYVSGGDAGSCAYHQMCGLTRDKKRLPDKEYKVMADYLIGRYLKGKASRPVLFYLAKDEGPLASILEKHGFRPIVSCTSKHTKYDVELWLRPGRNRKIKAAIELLPRAKR